MRRTYATVMVALLAALLLAAGCGSEDEDETAVQYKVLGGRLVWCSGGAEEMAVPGNASSIGNNAFGNCGSIGTLRIPASVTHIMRYTFSGVKVGIIYFGGTYDDWDAMAEQDGFGEWLGDTPVICADGKIWTWTRPAVPDVPVKPDDWQVADGVVTAYTGTETTVTLPDGVTAVEAGAIPAGTTVIFRGSREQWEELAANGDLTGLTVFAVDDDGTLVGYHGNGPDVVIPDGVTAIGGGVFAGHTELGHIAIPAGVTTIGADTFKDCAGLAGVVIPGGVTDIGDGAFSGCVALTDVTILGGVTDIGAGAFKDCTSLTDVTIPASVEHIGGGAFDGCTGLATVTYGGTLERLKELTEGSGIDLSAVNVNLSSWVIRNGVLVGYNGSETDIVIPDGVTAIGAGAFAGNAVLTGVTIPAGVTSIGDGAFSGCAALVGVEIPATVTSIGADAFKGCAGLTDMTIPATVTTIGADALACGNLETITFAGTVAQWSAVSGESGVGDDVIVTCTDGALPTTVYVASTGRDDNPGSRLKPLATIQKAVDTVIARNDGASAYTIFVDGTFTATSSAALADFSGLSQPLNIKIAGLSASNKAVIDGDNSARGIVVGAGGAQKDVNLTLENLVIQNTQNSGRGGGIALCCTAGNSHTIKNCEIKNNSAAYGSAIYNEYGSLDLQGCIISGNETGTSGTVYIGQASAILTMSDVRIESNSATNGGAVFLGNKATAKISDASVVIKNNSASGGNSRGPGISLWNGYLELSGSAKIEDVVGAYGDNSAYAHEIVISGALTGSTPVATITPSAYAAGTQVLSGAATTLAANCGKFELSQAGWKIDGEGKLAVSPDMYVSEGGDDTSGKGSQSKPFATLQKAVDTVLTRNDGASGYTIYVDGTLTQSTTPSGEGMADFTALDKNLNLTIKALSGTATLDANQKSRVMKARPASGILNLTLENLVITGGNTATGTGGGIDFVSAGGSLTMTGCVVRGNEANYGGGVYVNGGTFNLEGGTVSGNTAATSGGGVYVNGSTVTMKSGTISSNTATGYNGGGVYVKGSTFTMEDGTISDNTATGYYGGGVHIESGTFTMSGGTMSGNTANINGGGIYVTTGTFNMSGGTISKNTANSDGGGIFNAGTLKMTGGAVENNEAKYGGGVLVSGGTFTMSGGTTKISGNTASGNGGGVFVYNGGEFTMSGGTLSENTANSDGGGIFNASTVTMSGAASIPAGENSKNDVYLASGKTITVAGTLTAESPVATITLPNYTAGTQVLSAGDDVTLDGSICNKFAVTPQADGTGWRVAPNNGGTDGVLAEIDTIYLDYYGSNANLGLTASGAVNRLSKAIELYDAYNAQKIMVCANYKLRSDESTLLDRAGKRNLTLVRYDGSSDVPSSFTGTLLSISQGDVAITNVTLDGSKEKVTAGGALLYIGGSSTIVTLGDGAILCNNKKKGNGSGVYIDSGTFRMTGGTVTENDTVSYRGAGVYLNGGKFEMSGGKIIGNTVTTSHYEGGGVYINGGTFEMSGGEISGNEAYRGGGVYINDSCTFNMTDGKITGNIATNSGGGVFNGGTFTMSGGEITGNTASSGGNGVFTSIISSATFTKTDNCIVQN